MSEKSHHGPSIGFAETNIHKTVRRIQTAHTKGDWRNTHSMKIPYTYVTQVWLQKSTENTCKVLHLCPWGMTKAVTAKLVGDNCKSSLNVIPTAVVSAFDLTKETFDRSDLQLSATVGSMQAAKPFNRVFCTICDKESLPLLLNKYKGMKTLGELIRNWDDLEIAYSHMNIVGCFIDLNPKVFAGPNKRKYLEIPSDHFREVHPDKYKEKMTAKDLKRHTKHQASLGVKPPKLMTLEKPDSDSTPPGNDAAQCRLSFRRTHVTNVPQLMKYFKRTNVPLIGKCNGPVEAFGKSYCLSMVHVGVNKCLSNESILENYRTAMHGMQAWQGFCNTRLELDMPSSSSSNSTPPMIPPTIQINKNNIPQAEAAILDAYKSKPDSIYSVVKKSAFWGFMHDGITKFTKEYNGVYVRGMDNDGKPINVPMCLRRLKGSVDAHVLAEDLIHFISDYVKVDGIDSAWTSLTKHFDEDLVTPPFYTKLGVLEEMNEDTKVITIRVTNMPVGNCGDGVFVNGKAARVMLELFGIWTISLRCSAHTADGSLKRIARSETMCVKSVKTCYESLRSIVNHFTLSSQSKDLLDESLRMLELKPIHLLSWCNTRMAHFLDACERFDTIILAIHDTLYSADKKKEERDALFSVLNIYIVKLLKDVRGIFSAQYLRPVDRDTIMASESYNIAQNTAVAIDGMETPSADNLLDALWIDDNGNVHADVRHNDGIHTLRFSNYHKPSRAVPKESRLQQLKDELVETKREVLQNLKDNIQDQCSTDSMYYNWSGLDFTIRGLSLDERVNRLDALFHIFCTEKVHTVQQYLDAKETKCGDVSWNGFKIQLKFERKIECNPKDLEEEFRKSWPVLNRLWLAEFNASKKEKRQPSQATVIHQFIGNNSIDYPYVSNFLQILICTPPNTSCVERGYTFLEMVCAKRRSKLSSKNIEVLFLLASLKLPVGDLLSDPDCYIKSVELLS